MARKKTGEAAKAEAAPEPKPEPKAAAKPAPAAPKKKAEPKAEPKPEPKPVAPMPAEEPEEQGEARKPRRRAGANKKKAEDALPDNEKEKKRFAAEKQAAFDKEFKALEKKVPTVESLGSGADVLSNAEAAKAKCKELLGEEGKEGLLSAALARLKVLKPKKGQANFDEDAAVTNLEFLEAEATFEAYRRFSSNVDDLRDRIAERVKEINQAADKAGDQRRLDENASKVASLKKCTVADLAKKGGLRAMNLDVSFEMMQLCFAPTYLARRFEDAHGVVVDRARGKGGGKGKGGGQQLKLMGLGPDVTACAAALKNVNLSSSQSVSTEGKRAGAIIGSGGEKLREIEKKYDVVCAAGKSEIQVIGEKEGVEKAVAEVKKQLDEASAQATVELDGDLGKCLVTDGGKLKQSIVAESGAIVNVNFDRECSVSIRGAKDAVQKATALVEKFKKNTTSALVKCDPEAMSKLFRGGKGGGKGENVAAKFSELQKKYDLPTVPLQKADGVKILGEKSKVAACKVDLEALVVKAAYTTDTMEIEHREQLRVLSDDSVESIAADSGAEVFVLRQKQCIEIHGSAKAKAAATAALTALLDNEGRISSVKVAEEAIPAFSRGAYQLLKELQDSTGCQLTLSKTAPYVMTILGGQTKLAGAEQAVRAAATKFIESQALMVDDTIDIEEEEAGLLIGKQGATVKWLMKTSGCDNIKVDNTLVTLRGTKTAVAAAKKLVADTIAAKGQPEEEDVATWDAPKPQKKEEPKKKEVAPDIESANLFPSLGASLGAAQGGSKRKARGRHVALEAKTNGAPAAVEAPAPVPEAPATPEKADKMPTPKSPAKTEAKPSAKSPKANGVAPVSVALEKRTNTVGSRLDAPHAEYWAEFREEHAKEVLELAASEA